MRETYEIIKRRQDSLYYVVSRDRGAKVQPCYMRISDGMRTREEAAAARRRQVQADASHHREVLSGSLGIHA